MKRQTDPKVLGRKGEDRASAWYQANGYQILERNWRCEHGEIDIIAADAQTLVFAEVKSRASTRWGTPFEAVTAAKQHQVRKLATAWLGANPSPSSRRLRFDAASYVHGRIEVVEDAF